MSQYNDNLFLNSEYGDPHGKLSSSSYVDSTIEPAEESPSSRAQRIASTTAQSSTPKQKANSGMSCLASFCYLLLALPGAMWEGFVLSLLWAWFMVPVFHAPTITVAQAMGLDLLINLIITRLPTKPDKDDEKPFEHFGFRVFVIVLAPALALLFGFIMHFFV